MRFHFLFWIAVLFLGISAQGQQSLFRAKGQKYLEKATFYQIRHDYEKAINYYQKSIRFAPGNVATYFSLAQLYRSQQDFNNAAYILNKCTSCSGFGYSLQLASDLFRAQQYNDASKLVNKLSHSPQLQDADKKQIKRLQKSISLAQRVSFHLPEDTAEIPQNMGDRINSPFDEYFPSINLNDSVLVFTRKTNGMDQDFYLAQRDSCGGWLVANPLGSPPNSPRQEGAQMLSADGHYLFFSRCQNESQNGWALGGCDLYFSYDVPGGWSQPVAFGATLNTPAYEGMPSLSPDNKVLYFVSDRIGGYGGKDIWMSRFEDGLWQVPENLGPEINTAGDETAPWIASDNKTLYFTSNGQPGLGGNDLYLSYKEEGGHWSPAFNLGYPINSPADDVSITVANDGKKAYFASNRTGGKGAMDLYEVQLPEHIQPYPRTFFYGLVKDSLTGQRLPLAILKWTNLETGTVIAQYESNWGDASFISAFPMNTSLGLEVSRYNYLTMYDTFCLQDRHIYPPDTLMVSLLPFDYNPPSSDTNLLTVYFEKNKSTISDSVKMWVKSIVSPYINGKYNEYFIDGFTDTSGIPAMNADISFQRAYALKAVLVETGVPESKIYTQGWSDSSPVASNQTEEGRALNRRAVLVLRRPDY